MKTKLDDICQQLIPQIACSNCSYEAQIPVERARLEQLSDSCFREEAMDYLHAGIAIAERRLMNLRKKQLILITSEPPISDSELSEDAAMDIITKGIEAKDEQGEKLKNIFKFFTDDDYKISLGTSLSGLNNKNAAAMTKIFSAYWQWELNQR